jgi:hypothetical protein
MSLGPERSDVAAPPVMPGTGTEEPTRQLSVAGTSDHCINCGAPLASDQRYCVNCGERRGKPRFALAADPQTAVQEVATTTSSSSSPRRPRTSAGFNLIAGIATLLLALGVGVLIGHSSSQSSTAKQAAAPNITINGGGGTANGAASTAASTGSTGANGGNGGSAKKSKKGSSTKAAKTPAVSKVVVQKAAAAASKVTGGSAKVADPTAQQGSSCSNGTAGCQNGQLTGNYFGQ